MDSMKTLPPISFIYCQSKRNKTEYLLEKEREKKKVDRDCIKTLIATWVDYLSEMEKLRRLQISVQSFPFPQANPQ